MSTYSGATSPEIASSTVVIDAHCAGACADSNVNAVCLQAADIVVATPSSACHISLAKQRPAEEEEPKQDPFGKEYPYQSVNSAEGGGDAGENFKVMPMQHPILLLAYTSPSSLLLVTLLFSTSDSRHAVPS